MSGYIFILNRRPVSWCLKRQSTVALSSTEAEYVILILALKEATWLRLLLIELDLQLPEDQYAEIKVAKRSKGAKKIKANLRSQEEKDNKGMASKFISINSSTSIKAIQLKIILLKSDN